MIHPDGTIDIEVPCFIISSKTTREDFLASPLFAISEPLNQNTPWSCYGFGPVKTGGEGFSCNVRFCSGFLRYVEFVSIRPEFESTQQWDAKHCFHKNLLETIFARLPDECRGIDSQDVNTFYNFSWGLAGATRDPKSDWPFIVVRYGNL
jgi:hypothetical protein